MQIKFEDFRRIMNRVVMFMKFQDAIYEDSRVYLKGFDYELNFPTLLSDTLELLALVTNDVEGWISYWVFDLYCGEQGDCTVAYNGEEFQLRTIDDLWWLIQRCNLEDSEHSGEWSETTV